jgi:hypothetical protein
VTETGTWKCHNFVTGVDEPIRINQDPGRAWGDGWEDYMRYGESCKNPYPENTQEYNDWQEGWEAAKRD